VVHDGGDPLEQRLMVGLSDQDAVRVRLYPNKRPLRSARLPTGDRRDPPVPHHRRAITAMTPPVTRRDMFNEHRGPVVNESGSTDHGDERR